jgi:DNA-binding CsgD family transcriptional regulator
MIHGDDSDFSNLLLQLYRHCHDLPLDAFQDAALELIKPALPFDTAIWGTATMTPGGVDIHNVHRHLNSQEMLDDYEHVKHEDTAAASVARHRSATEVFHSPTHFAATGIGAFLSRYGHENFFVTVQGNPATRFLQWISLYRADPEAHCRDDERRLLARLQPHLMQALALSRVRHLEHLAPRTAERPRGVAIADLRGVIYHAAPQFEELLRSEWRGDRPGVLPRALLEHFLHGEERVVGRTLVVRRQVEHRLLFLRARLRCRADALTVRERSVADLIAQGGTHKEVARRLSRAPATIRNQLQSIYAKLEVANVAGLIEALKLAD